MALQAALVEEHEICEWQRIPVESAVKADRFLASEGAATWIFRSHLARRTALFAEGTAIFLMNCVAASITACG